MRFVTTSIARCLVAVALALPCPTLLAADSVRLAEAQRTRPGGAPAGPRARVGLLGAVISGSLDRAMDVAATRELREYAAKLALDLAEQRIRTRLDAGTEAGLVDDFTKDLQQQGSKN